MKKIKKLLLRLKKINREYINKTRYLKYYKNLKIIDNYILLDTQHGTNINGNIFYVAEELISNPIYKNYKIFIPVMKNKYNDFKELLNNKGMNSIRLVLIGSKEYYQLLASCKYLINDTSFLPFYIKKEGQVYLNLWHGTPLKYLGKSVSNGYHAIGNVQKNFIESDYLLYPNDYMKEHMIKDYMLENICHAKVLMSGYPRNTIFFDKDNRKKIRSELNVDEKQVIAYMPTYRDTLNKLEEVEHVNNILKKIDNKLNDNQIMYVNLHPFVGNKITYNFKHIKKFPSNYETYEFLAISDMLITDYSSVFYDYAITNNKIILFNYDEDDYFKERGCYVKLSELPFPKAKTINKLISEINNNKKYDYKEFLKTYSLYENKDATKLLCERVILNKKNSIIEKEITNNGKKNILIYTGSLSKNGLTTSLLNLMNTIPKEKYNIYLTFSTKVVAPYAKTLRLFPDYINYIPVDGKLNASILEKIKLYLYYNKGYFAKFLRSKVLELNKYEIRRAYHDIKFDSVIQFGGYDSRKIILFTLFDCNKVIYVHSDMNKEISTRGNQKRHILEYAYDKYDKVAVVSDGLIEPTKKLVADPNKLRIVRNVIDYKSVIEKSNKPIKFDDDTICNIDLKELKRILNCKKYKKFINVGRFSPEKGHERLIRAFDRIYKKNKDSYLIIIGGHGALYSSTMDLISSLKCKKNIIVIKSIINPFPIIKKSDCFILSSLYEGFGLVLAEADILGLQSFSVDISGPRSFIKNNNGNLVENSEEGIYKGMNSYLQGKLNQMTVDYESYNENALEAFYDLVE